MAKNNNMTIVIVLAIAALAYFLIAGNPFATDDVATVPIDSLSVCGVEDVAFHPLMTRLGKAGTSLSTAANNYFIITDTLGSQAGNADTTVATEKNLEILFGENSTTYYTVHETGINTGCSDPFNFAVSLALSDTDVEPYVYSQGDKLTDSNEKGMDADDIFESTVFFKAGVDTYFGNPGSECQNIAVVQYDKTYFQSASSNTASASAPHSHSYFNSSYDGRDAFYIPKSADGEEVSFVLTLETASVAPDASSANPKITIYDCDIDKHEDTLDVIFGVDDEDGNLLSLSAQTFDVYIE